MPINLNDSLAWTKADQDEQALLNDLQGNILKGHGRNHTLNVFLRFDATAAASAKNFIRQLGQLVTSAARQLQDTKIFQRTGQSAGTFYTFFLSAAGYQALGFKGNAVPGDANSAFQLGMKKRQAALADPAVSTWDTKFQLEVHAMLLIADSEKKRVTQAYKTLKKIMPASVIILGKERGRAMRNENGDGIEHFGYVDGRSQPLLLKEEVDEEKNTKDGISVWNPCAPLKLALVPDPGGKTPQSFGSFFVFRKLEQNVKGFKEREDELAAQLKLNTEAGALVVGRFEDGTPVILQKDEGAHHPVLNNFTYKDDPDGLKCPFHAHIRKTNPRGEAGTPLKDHLLVRRGITYGKRAAGLTDKPTGGVGLLFMDYQSSIEKQFEFVQKNWANNSNFPPVAQPYSPAGLDPVLGQGPASDQFWPTTWGKENKEPFSFSGFVTLKGGEYFFAPSLSFLLSL